MRVLTTVDLPHLESFLAVHCDSSMFLRSNLRQSGLGYHGEPGEAEYVGAFEGDAIVGVAALCWNGMLLLQAPSHAADLARTSAAFSGRPVTGLAGPPDQVTQARRALGLHQAEAAIEGDEWMYALDLSDVVIPDALANGSVTCRPPTPTDHDVLYAWRMAYDIELLGASDTPEHRQRSAAFLDAQLAAHNVWVAESAGVVVSLSAFNATLPDIVQLGGIYTPPEFRGRGFAKVVVAASLLEARARGASRAVLFTNNPSAARTYEALGFRRVGDYCLVLLR